MNRSARGSKKSSSSGQNMVTILFVLGIIGWGFFAIDRLTETDRGVKTNKVQGRALGQEAGWKKNVRDWLTKKLSSEGGAKESEAQSVSRNVPLEPEPKGLKREDFIEAEAQAATAEDAGLAAKPDSGEAQTVTFLFYKLNSKGTPVLSRVRRDLAEDKSDLKSMVSQLIKGPTIGEQDKDYIDSFIRKPRILGAGVEDGCGFVNFDSAFGAGVSYQTLRFQIQQIFRNMEAWKGVQCLELRVRGRHTSHLGSDGLYLPKRIDAAWLKENL